MQVNKYIDILPEVADALKDGRGVVALESTIISHGMPYPQNLDTSNKCEQIIRDEGAVPAVIAIIAGRIKVGLSPEHLDLLARGAEVRKISRRDLAACIADGANGATTVAATMIIANMVGIKMFATGGIGGVHRGVAETWDISADLQELASTDVCVVCAGVKSILDISKTLEYLETMGVPVYSAESQDFPAFFTRTSGLKSDRMLKDPKEAAAILKAKSELGLKGGVLIANPIPKEHSMDETYISDIIAKAVAEANAKGVRGKDITPFLLDYVVKASGGDSLKANMELVWNNCKLAAQVAVNL